MGGRSIGQGATLTLGAGIDSRDDFVGLCDPDERWGTTSDPVMFKAKPLSRLQATAAATRNWETSLVDDFFNSIDPMRTFEKRALPIEIQIGKG
jgi:hypothetical protein